MGGARLEETAFENGGSGGANALEEFLDPDPRTVGLTARFAGGGEDAVGGVTRATGGLAQFMNGVEDDAGVPRGLGHTSGNLGGGGDLLLDRAGDGPRHLVDRQNGVPDALDGRARAA